MYNRGTRASIGGPMTGFRKPARNARIRARKVIAQCMNEDVHFTPASPTASLKCYRQVVNEKCTVVICNTFPDGGIVSVWVLSWCPKLKAVERSSSAPRWLFHAIHRTQPARSAAPASDSNDHAHHRVRHDPAGHWHGRRRGNYEPARIGRGRRTGVSMLLTLFVTPCLYAVIRNRL